MYGNWCSSLSIDVCCFFSRRKIPVSLFDVTNSNSYFSFDVEISAINLSKIRQSIVTGDDCGVCFAVGCGFHGRRGL